MKDVQGLIVSYKQEKAVVDMVGWIVALISGALMSIQGGMNRLGPARAVQLIVVSQIAVAYLIELFGLFGVEKTEFQWSKVLGLGLSIIGIIIVKWK